VNRPELCVGAVAVHDGALLLVRRGRGPAAGAWSVPGGRVEAGETLAEAVVREVAEETGLECVCGALVGWVEIPDAEQPYVVLDFEAIVLDPGTPVAGDDAAEVAWVDLADVAEKALVDGLAEFLHDHGIIETIA
jgi:8-oxo-dGTP diphosphatase